LSLVGQILILEPDVTGPRGGGNLVLSVGDGVKHKNTRLFTEYFSAERVGFEPTVAGEGYNGFRDRPNRPLWHLSYQLPANYIKPGLNHPGSLHRSNSAIKSLKKTI
jgi:hypothetical protein